MTAKEVYNQIESITSKLILVGLSEEQNFPAENDGYIYISGNQDLSVALKNVPYGEVYKILDKTRNYNIKLMDGALLQLMYSFERKELKKARLAFFPSPKLEEFQNNPEVYELDEIYADVINRNIVTTPLRFDYDRDNQKPVDHPISHLTIGQYKNCRIPVSKPPTPYLFVDFILRNFYNTALLKFTDKLKFLGANAFSTCIHEEEERLVHIKIG